MEKREAEKIVGEIKTTLERSIVSESLLHKISKEVALLQIDNTKRSIKGVVAYMNLDREERSRLSTDYDYMDRVKLEIEKL